MPTNHTTPRVPTQAESSSILRRSTRLSTQRLQQQQDVASSASIDENEEFHNAMEEVPSGTTSSSSSTANSNVSNSASRSVAVVAASSSNNHHMNTHTNTNNLNAVVGITDGLRNRRRRITIRHHLNNHMMNHINATTAAAAAATANNADNTIANVNANGSNGGGRRVVIQIDRHHHHHGGGGGNARSNLPVFNINVPGFSSQLPSLRPLQPQPLPLSEYSSISGSNGITNEEEEKYKCSICLEYLEIPVGCGNCVNRFCFKCLEKTKTPAIASGANNNGANNNNQDQKNNCPCCRQHFESPFADTELLAVMVTEMMTCPNAGCGMSISRAKMREHDEKECYFVKVKCKYVQFGCKWTGLRSDVSVHEEEDCHLCKISGLVDHCRRMNQQYERQATQILSIRNALNQANQLIHLQRNALVELQNESKRYPRNIIDMMEFVLQCAISPVRVWEDRQIWKAFYKTPKARSYVYDFMTFAPTCLIFVKVNNYFSFVKINFYCNSNI